MYILSQYSGINVFLSLKKWQIVRHTIVALLYTLNRSIVVHAYKIVITYLLILLNTIKIPVLSFFFKSKNRRPLSPPARPAVRYNKETPVAHVNKEKIKLLTEEMYVKKCKVTE